MLDELTNADTAAPVADLTHGAWPAMLDLAPTDEAVPDIDPLVLPSVLYPWLRDAAERLGVPMAPLLATVLVSAGVLTGNTFGVNPKARDTSWIEHGNLWGLVHAPPSSKKTPILNAGLQFIKEIEADEAREYTKKAADIEATIASLDTRLASRKKALEKAERYGDEEAVARESEQVEKLTKERQRHQYSRPQMMVNDSTVEALTDIMVANPNGVCLTRDEFAGVLQKLDAPGRENDRAFFTEAYNPTGSYTVNRIGRGTTRIESPTLSLIGCIQPAVIKPHLDKAIREGGGDGFLARCQLSVSLTPKQLSEGADRAVDIEAQQAVRDALRALNNLAKSVRADERRELPLVLKYDPEAQAHMDEWRARLDGQIRSGEFDKFPAFLAHLGKTAAAANRLALNLHLLKHAATSYWENPIKLDTVVEATSIMDHFVLQARRLYEIGENPALDDAIYLRTKCLDGTVDDGMTVRTIQQRCKPLSGSAEHVRRVVKVLEDHGIARLEVIAGAGSKPSEIIRLHPDLRVPNQRQKPN